MNYNGFNWASPSYNIPTPPRNSNIILVTGSDEAVMRTPNDADMIYIDQNKPVLYRVVSDAFGRKSIAEYTYTTPNTSPNAPVTRAEFDGLVAKVDTLLNPKQEVTPNEQPVQ